MPACDREGRYATGTQSGFTRHLRAVPRGRITAVGDQRFIRRRRQSIEIYPRRGVRRDDEAAVQALHFRKIDFSGLRKEVALRLRCKFVEKCKNLRLTCTLKFGNDRMKG